MENHKSNSTNNRRKASNFSPSGAVSAKSPTSRRNKNGLTRISPTVGVTPRVFGMSSSTAERSNLGASTKPANEYKATSNVATPAMRKAVFSVNFSTGHPLQHAAASRGLV